MKIPKGCVRWSEFKAELLKDPEFKRGYDALAPEFELIEMLIQKRLDAGLSQADLAEKIGTKQSAVSRLESPDYNPTVGMLRKVAGALGGELKVSIQ